MPAVNENYSSRHFFNDSISIDSHGKTVINDTENTNLTKIGARANRNLQLIILPTEKCNFRCTYCYEDYSVGKMKQETVLGIKALLDRRCADLEHLNLSWFGGEPLVAKSTVFEISEYAMELTHKYSGLVYIGDMTTNGYLLNYDTAKALADVGVRHYQISLDGSRDVHNQSRIRADGGHTYDRIWANLLAIRDSSLPVKVILRIHFTVDTLQLITPLLEDIKKEFLQDSRFFVFFKAVERLGGPNDASIKIFSDSEKEKAVELLKTKLYGESAARLNSHEPQYVCYASRPNSLVIRANGDVGKCTVALYDERNKIGTLQPNGTLELIPGRLAPWLRGLKTLDPETLACPLSQFKLS
ncbi:MAG: radical SAM protein [Coleofasciculus sp. S288]|nr:radical SAM protein [Coleofasciculus sp. S288]